ncbi:hypothetical protein OQ252_13015 [Acetobacter farinalis]|uniref:Uncharacterized protein n=1 Tax=Acetobacter farinalis TaxID=1260984 RepID=A0ABT3QAJ9_9PROT|nr:MULTISPECIES: hypothetical protein [Acetobacteraceae]MCX2562307.1 hypothetical protein [Acetobacter farinalis]NHO30919.1 hypothetical protein [Acetobacter farinalis]TWB05635.1 hypothetical protein FBZ86_11562 [Gluconacetobacter diazotrophicus]
MGPEELAIIMSPQFINATFRAGEDWYHDLVARNQEVQRRYSFEAANAQYQIVNQQILDKWRRQNEEWRRHTQTIADQSNERIAQSDRIQAEIRENHNKELRARQQSDRDLHAMTALCSKKDAAITQLQTDLAGVRGSLGAAQDEIARERQSLAASREEVERTQSALQAAQNALAHERQSHASMRSHAGRLTFDLWITGNDCNCLRAKLKETEDVVSSLEASRREAALVTQSVEAAGTTVMYVTAQAMEAWAAQGKASMLDNLMTSHFKAAGQPMTMREYLWFATLIKEMKGRNISDRLIAERCPVDGIEDFLVRDVAISEDKVETDNGRDIFLGWIVVDGVCHPFGAETKRRCMQMMAGFIRGIPEEHALCEKEPRRRESDIELLMSDKDIDPDKIDRLFWLTFGTIVRCQNTKISGFMAPCKATVHGGKFQGGLSVAIADDGNEFSALVSFDEDGARSWLAGHVAEKVGPALGRPGLSIQEARSLMKTDTRPSPVVDVLPLTVSVMVEMRLRAAALVAAG